MEYQQIQRLFPSFAEIQDDVLKEASFKAMRMAMEEGGWNEENIMLCPVTLNWKDCDVSWVEHVNDVVLMCIAQFDGLEKYYRRHGVAFSRDTVISGALLHDIGKLTEFSEKNGAVVHGKDYELMRHPLSGALIAAKAGLPNHIIHLIATHSFEGDHSYHTNESWFVRTIDMFVFNNSVKGLKRVVSK